MSIPDEEFCGDLGMDGGTCFHTLVSDHRDIPKPEWDVYRFGQICEEPKVFADSKAIIEKLCSISGRCSYEDKKKLQTFINKTQNIKPNPH